MSGFSPKIEIINHFDNLINRVDIEIEKSLGKYNEKQNIGEIRFIKTERNLKFPFCSHMCFYKSPDALSTNQSSVWSESSKVVDYLNHVRNSTIEELKTAQKDSIDYFNSISFQFKQKHDQLTGEKNLDEIKSEIFGKKFHFQVRFEPKQEDDEWIFNLYTIVSDFYMSPSDINILEKMINNSHDKNSLDCFPNIILDEKMVLIGLIQNLFFQNMNNTQEMPNHMIRVSKQDLLNVRSIIWLYNVDKVRLTYFPIYFPLKIERLVLKCLLKQIQIEDFSSLKSLDFKFRPSLDGINIRNLIGLEELKFQLLGNPINSDIQVKFFDQSPNVKKLTLTGNLSNINFDNLYRLQEISLNGFLNQDFNYDLLKNLSNQLTHFSINSTDVDNKTMSELFSSYNFPNLKKFCIMNTKITKIEKDFLGRFQSLEDLMLFDNEQLQTIDYDCFSNLKRLNRFSWIDSYNSNSIKFDKRHFSQLPNLEYLKLRGNFDTFEENMFSDLKNLKHLDLSVCKLNDLNSQWFLGLENLEILELQNNKFTRFDLSILKNLSRIKKICLPYHTIINKKEILNHQKDSKIKFKFAKL